MRIVTGLILILSLSACSKQAPSPAAVAPAAPAARPGPAENVGGSLPPDKNDPSGPSAVAQAMADKKAPPTPDPTVTASAEPAAASLDGLPSVGLAKDGAAIFTATCATCHMADGFGVPYMQPSIRGSAWISSPDPQLLLSLILRGSAILGDGAQAYANDMAPQDHLSDAEIAAVASYVRQRFAAAPINEPVTPAQVAIARNRPGLPE